MKALVAAFAAGSCIALTACGQNSAAKATAPTTTTPSTATASTSSTPAPTVDYAAQYLRLVAPPNAAADVLGDTLDALAKRKAGNAAYIPPFTTYAAALQTWNNVLLRSPWPEKVLPDVKALVGANADEIAAVNNLITAATTNRGDFQGLFNAWGAAGTKGSTAANVVRADLGLPPPGSTPSPSVSSAT